MGMVELGVVYTPREVCGPMVELALAPLVAGRSADEILALRICDPAIGEGAFLLEIVRVLAAAVAPHLGRRDARRLVAARCIYGVDIDARAVAAARRAVESFVGEPVPALREHLRVGDALAIDWEPHDAIVGNPPYVRQERLGAAKRALRSFASYDGVADLYVYFIELAHRVVRPGGRYCLVVPNKWLTAAYGRPLRALLAREASLERVVDFGQALPLFGDADAFPCIIAGTVGVPARGARASVRATRVTGDSSVAAALAATGTAQPRSRWGREPWHIDGAGDGVLLERLARTWPTLGDRLPGKPSRGVVTGCNRAFVIDAETRARLVDAEPAAATLIRPFVKGRDVRRWRAAPIDRYLLVIDRGTSLAGLSRVRRHLQHFRAALEPGSGRKPGSYRWFELQDPVVPLAKSRAPRLFYQDIQSQPACSLDDTGELVPDTTVWIAPTDDRYLLAVLNSRLYGWYARHRFPPALNGAVRPKLEYMRLLPIATPPRDLRARIVSLVDEQLADPDRARDARLDTAICDAYELSRRERALLG
jgi:hypothetical protein